MDKYNIIMDKTSIIVLSPLFHHLSPDEGLLKPKLFNVVLPS